MLRKNKIPKGSQLKLSNELRYKGKAHIMTTHRGKSHNELGKKIIIIANIIQKNMQLLEI